MYDQSAERSIADIRAALGLEGDVDIAAFVCAATAERDALRAACGVAKRWLDALNDPDEQADDMTLAWLKQETERAVYPALRAAALATAQGEARDA